MGTMFTVLNWKELPCLQFNPSFQGTKLMRVTPFKYLEKAANDRLRELQRIIADRYGELYVPKAKVFFTVDTDTKFLASCKLHFRDTFLDEYDPCEADDCEKEKIYKTYGVHHMTFNTFLINDLKLPYVRNVVGHEFSHACVVHIHSMRHLIYDYCKTKSKKIMPHGPEFRKFCRLFDLDKEYYKAKSDIAQDNAKWNISHGRPHKMWCSCNEFYVDPAMYQYYLTHPDHKCPNCNDSVTPYGVYDHPKSVVVPVAAKNHPKSAMEMV